MSSAPVSSPSHSPLPAPSADHARGLARLRRIGWTAAASLGLRVLSLGCSFLTVRLAVGYLGEERYGYWVAMSSVVTLLSFTDCGVGYGLLNLVSSALGRDDREGMRRAISNTFFVLLGLATVFLLLSCTAYFVMPWPRVFATHDPGIASECGAALIIMAGAFFISLPFNTVQRVQFGHQEGYLSNLWQGGGVLLSLAGMLLAIHCKGDLRLLALGFTLGPFVALVANWLYYFILRYPDLRPRIADHAWEVGWSILKQGSLFLVLQVATIVVFSTDNLILLHFFGPDTVTQYNLVAKLFQIGPILAGIWFAPLWPAYAEAVARGDVAWSRRTLKQTTLLSMAGCAGVCLLLALGMRPLVHLWAGIVVTPSLSLLLAFSFTSLLVVGTSSIAAYLNAMNYIRQQVWLVLIHATLSLGLALTLPRFLGSAGIAWSTVCGYCLVIVPAYFVLVPRLLRRQAAAAPAA